MGGYSEQCSLCGKWFDDRYALKQHTSACMKTKPLQLHVTITPTEVVIKIPSTPMSGLLPLEVVELARSLNTDVLGMALVQLACEFHKRCLKWP
jgi:hypothetical protein